MKKLMAVAVLLSVGLFTFGCGGDKPAPKKPDAKAPTASAPAPSTTPAPAAPAKTPDKK